MTAASETLTTTPPAGTNGAEPQHKGLAAKLLAAQRSVDAVVKRGHNTGTGSGYKYATAADVIEVSRKALHDVGLVGFIESVKTVERTAITSGKGTAGMYAEVAVELRIIDPDLPQDDSSFVFGHARAATFTASGAGTDYPGDKAVYKAQTGATKYAYANALALPFADHDPERDVEGVAGRLPKQEADPATALPDERVDELGKLLKGSDVGFKKLCVYLGSIGAEAPKIKRPDSIRKALASLSPEQAEQMAGWLDAMEATDA